MKHIAETLFTLHNNYLSVRDIYKSANFFTL